MGDINIMAIASVLITIGGFWDYTKKTIRRHEETINELRSDIVSIKMTQARIEAKLDQKL